MERLPMELHVVRWTLPLAALVVAANIWMALIYAHGLAALGLAPGSFGAAGPPGPALGALPGGLGLFGFWAIFFGLLGLNNMLGLAAFGRWAGAVAHEQNARAEIRAAIRWPTA